MAESLASLIRAVRDEAARLDFPVDRAVYERSGKDPHDPILHAGSLDAPVCLFARDLGKDEVRLGQPLVGAGGRLVRIGILRAWNEEPVSTDPIHTAALRHVLLTNTVPFKPPDNKAYPEAVKKRFRPFLARLLGHFWEGSYVITLGTEAFRWFEPYGDEAQFRTEGMTDSRFESIFPCTLPGTLPIGTGKALLVLPLPHPSPLNRRWYGRFPAMLADRLAEVRSELGRESTPKPG